MTSPRLYALLSRTLKPVQVARGLDSAKAKAEKDSRVEFIRPCWMHSPFDEPKPNPRLSIIVRKWKDGWLSIAIDNTSQYIVEG